MSGQRIKEMPEGDRPRERLLALGAKVLSNRDLVAILLNTGTKSRSVFNVAEDLLTQHESLCELSRCRYEDLSKIHGIGPAKAAYLAAAFELASRVARETIERRKVDTPDLVVAHVAAELRAQRVEVLKVLLLDTRLRLLSAVDISKGSLNESVAHPREIFREAIVRSAYAIIVVHNHPSGDPSPSEADSRLTRRLAEVASLHDIKLIDHIIIGSPSRDNPVGYFSFREAGLL
jgi:DNA repair protein RadC